MRPPVDGVSNVVSDTRILGLCMVLSLQVSLTLLMFLRMSAQSDVTHERCLTLFFLRYLDDSMST